jgi:hypothetical protein
VTGAQIQEWFDFFSERFSPYGVKDDLLQTASVAQRHVARAVGAAGERAIDLAERDAVRHLHHRGEAGAAGALHVVGRRARMQARGLRRLARQVPVARMLDHRPRGDLAEHLALQRILVHQRFHRRGGHVEVAGMGVGGVGARERDAGAAEDGDASWQGHGRRPR